MSWDGKVVETFTDRLHRVAPNGTGYLEVHDVTRERRGWVFLEDQHVVAVLVDGYQPRLARRLIASELVSVADMGEVLTVTKDEYDPRIAVECVARGLVDARTMEVLYREFMLSAASFVDEWQLGHSQWVAGVRPWEGRSSAVSVPLLASAMVRRREHWARLWTELSTVTIPDRVPIRIGSADYLPTGPDEAAVLRAIDGCRTVDQVAGECGFTRFQTGHILSGLMARKVLDLFPVNGSQPTVRSLKVEAGYYAASEPIPDVNAPQEDACADGRPPGGMAPRQTGAVPMAVGVPGPAQGRPASEARTDSTHETTHAAATGPVAADDPEGNVVSEHVEFENRADEPQSWVGPAEEQVAATDEHATTEHATTEHATDAPAADEADGEVARETDVGTGAPHWHELDERSHPATNLGEFFVNSNLRPGADEVAPPLPAAVQQHALPPLPAITGGPSDFYAVLPSALPRGPAGMLGAALPVLPSAMPAAEYEPAGSDQVTSDQVTSDQMTPDQMTPDQIISDQMTFRVAAWAGQSEPVAEREAVAGPGSEGDLEVTGLRVELLRLATERKAAVEQAVVLREQAVLHSADADAAAAAALLEVAASSIVALTKVTNEASATAASHVEGLPAARNEDVRVAVLRALEAWAAAMEGAEHSVADAREAEAAAVECDQRIEEARRRLTEMANADR